MTANEVRAMRADFALRSHQSSKGESVTNENRDAAVIDLLTDLRHFCEEHDLCFADLLWSATSHYEAESLKAS